PAAGQAHPGRVLTGRPAMLSTTMHPQTLNRPPPGARCTGRRRASAGAFALVEMPVVISIILPLLGLPIAAVRGLSVAGSRAAAQQMATAIQFGLWDYKADFRENFPPSAGGLATNPPATAYSGDGGNIRAAAMYAPSNVDGKTGFGFK